MIQMYDLTNTDVVLYFLPEIHLEIPPPAGIEVMQILLKSFEQHIQIKSRSSRIVPLNDVFSKFDPI